MEERFLDSSCDYALTDMLREQGVLQRVQVTENVIFGRESIAVASEITDATIKLFAAFKDVPGAVIVDTGLFIFVKKASKEGNSQIFAKKLTVEERAWLDADPTLCVDADKLLKRLKKIKEIKIIAHSTVSAPTPQASERS